MSSPPPKPHLRLRPRGLLASLLADTAVVDLRLLGRTLIRAALVGAIAGALSAAFFFALQHGEELLLDQLAGYTPLRASGELSEPIRGAQDYRPWLVVLLPAVGALLASLLALRFGRESLGAGADAVVGAFHNQRGRVRARVVWLKPLTTLLTLCTGGSGGREGPTAHIGAAIGSTVAYRLGLDARERRILLVAGAAAGTAAIFRTPLGAALLAVEMLYRDDFETDALVPAVLASVTGYSVFISLYGEATLFTVAERYPFVPVHLPLYGAMAVLLGAVALVFARLLRTVTRHSARLPVWARAATGGLGVGLLGALLVWQTSPGRGLGILGGGYGAAQLAIMGADWLPIGAQGALLLLLLGAAKVIASSLTVGTGGSGGVFGPSLAIGALFGGAFGQLCATWLGDPRIMPGAFALVGMGAFYGGIAHVPLGALVMVCELSGSYDLLVPLMLAEAVALLMLRHATIFSAQRADKLHSPAHASNIRHVLKRHTVADVLDTSRPFVHFALGTPIGTVMERMAEQAWQDSFPVIGPEGKLLGMITPDILRIVSAQCDVLSFTVAADAMQSAVTIAVDDDLRSASDLLIRSGQRELIVLDSSGAIVGLLDEVDVSQLYLDATEEPPPETPRDPLGPPTRRAE